MSGDLMEYESFSEKDTMDIAGALAREARAGDIFCLSADLGCGKTVFAKGFAAALGIGSYVTSPTFTLINEYDNGSAPFYHFDVYRISSVAEMYDLGYEDYFFGGGICLIEWAELVEELIPDSAVWVRIKKDLNKGENYRIVEVLK